MKIATFNCNSVRARLHIITWWLKKHSPDILALQEIKAQNKDFPFADFEELGYHCEVQGKKGHAGVAVISRKKPDKAYPGFRDGDEDEYPRLLACKFGRLHFINTYCPQGRDPEHEQFRYKLKWFKRMRKYMDEYYTSRQQVIWVGDFNVAPEPIDVHNSKANMGHVVHRPEVFDALADVREWGFNDLFRKFHPGEEKQFSYFDYRVRNSVERKMGWRVDHIYATNSIVKKAVDCYIDLEPRTMEKPSDHTFMVADLDIG